MVIWRSLLTFTLTGLLAFSAAAQTPRAGEIPFPEPAIVPSVRQETLPYVASDGENYLVAWQSMDEIRAARVSRDGELLDRESLVVANLGYWSVTGILWDGSSYLVTQLPGSFTRLDRLGRVIGRGSWPCPGLASPIFTGTHFLVTCEVPSRDPRQYRLFHILLDENMQVVRDDIHFPSESFQLRASFIVHVGEHIFAFFSEASGLFATRISKDGTLTRFDQPFLTGPVISVAAQCGSANCILAWAEIDPQRQATVLRSKVLRYQLDGTLEAGPAVELRASTPFDLGHIVITPSDHGFLVSWTENHPYGLLARRLSPEGVPIDDQILLVTSTPVRFEYPSTASNGESFYLAWADGRRTGGSHNPWGALVPASGSEVTEQPLSLSRAAQIDPAAVSNGQFLLLAWSETGYEVSQRVVAARMTLDGELIDPAGIELSGAGTIPSIATDGEAFFVVWVDPQKPATQVYLIRGALVRPDGSVGPVQTISHNNSASAPRIAFDGLNYMVVWEEINVVDGVERNVVRVARVHRNGSLIDTMPFEIDLGRAPDIGFDGSNYWVSFETRGEYPVTKPGLFARRVSKGGFPFGSAVTVAAEVSPNTSDNSALACSRTDCMVTWSAPTEASSTDIFAAVLHRGGAVGPQLVISAEIGQEERPEISSDGINYLASWYWDGPQRTALLSPSGQILQLYVGHRRIRGRPVAIPGRPAVTYSINSLEPSESYIDRAVLRFLREPERRRPVAR